MKALGPGVMRSRVKPARDHRDRREPVGRPEA
jgi:hypothetical protein